MKCKHCPIVKECNKHPIFTQVPGPDKKPVQTRLCPLLILFGKVLEGVQHGQKTQ